MTLVPVIDISKWQGRVDFSRWRSLGIQGVIIRATNGTKLDERAHIYAPEARAEGLKVGFYGFCNPKAHAHGDQQARVLIDREAQLGVGELPLMMDVENYVKESGGYPVLQGPPFLHWLEEYKAEVIASTERVPINYSNAAYWNSWVRGIGSFAECRIIVARYVIYPRARRTGESLDEYGAYIEAWLAASPKVPEDAREWEPWLFTITTKRPQIPNGWDDWDGWQFSAGYNRRGPVYGCSSDDLDLNLIRPEAWDEWTGHTPGPVLPPPEVEPVHPPFVPRNRPPLTALTQGAAMSNAPAVLWRDPRYKNVFLIDGGSVIPVTGELKALYEAAGVAYQVSGPHDQLLASCLAKAGLDADDLIAV